jgi:type I restriction enzyme S subunit
MAKYKAYPEYKDSEIEWLGKIPSGWLLKKAKYIFQRVQRPLRDIDGVVTAFRDGQVTLRTNRRTDGFTNSVKEIGYQGVRRNDLVIHAMDGFAGAIGVSDSDGKCSPVCSVCIPCNNQSVNMYFYGYLVRQLAVTDFILSLAKGIRERSTEFRFSEFSGLMLPIPPIYEQNQIAAFLDHETAKIDNLIEYQRQLIELLKEKRQAVISHAVTKGLNPDVPMKDSGVEWLGDMPEHWIIKRLKHISPKVGVGLVINPSTYTKDEGVYFIFGGDVKEFGFDLTKTRRISPQDSNKLLPSRLNSRDLVSVRVGYPGITSVVTDDLEGSNCASIIIIRRGSYNSDWLCAAMNVWVGRQQVDLASYGAAQKQFNVSDAIEFVFPVPPINEQNDIADFVQKTLNKFDDLTQKAFKQIELLQERRTALISAAVTGKIDVRDWVAPDTQDIEASQEATA